MRRIHVPRVHPGPLTLPPAEAHHARDVLRLPEGAVVEVFDADGRCATATVQSCTAREVLLQVQEVREPAEGHALRWTIASALPKGPRVDWMVEKISELGTSAFVPLRTGRGVVLPEGHSKRQRWQRLAVEAAKQSHSPGIMRIEELTDLRRLLERRAGGSAMYLSTGKSARPMLDLLPGLRQSAILDLTFLIGPEGGWTEAELADLDAAGCAALSLGPTILRVETAAVAAAVLASSVAATALAP